MAREAWFYDELESLQGVVVPRCYGCFDLELQPGWQVPARHRARGDEPDELPLEFIETLGPSAFEQDPPPHPSAVQLGVERNRLFVLLFERAGPSLLDTLRVPALRELDDAYGELAILGVNMAKDITPQNILWAPDAPPGLPSIPSPYTNSVYSIRLIDFGMAVKTDMTRRTIRRECRSWARKIGMGDDDDLEPL
ncbi:hypothetical protein AURDEDRAFT_158351 [Auricularia subglabra TFB-10046 SS5]|nr:hypothetical protein AURDEDRAFT_158351 [Auricularia subglabra TFB-10046 SS5]